MNKIHATHFWVYLLATLGGFIECENRSNLWMGASNLLEVVAMLVNDLRQYFFF
jgi:hypothetical protein